MLYYVLQPHGCTYHMYYLLILGRVCSPYTYTYKGTLQYIYCVRVLSKYSIVGYICYILIIVCTVRRNLFLHTLLL